MPRSTRNTYNQGAANIWPGFVDALATLLLVIIFLLVVFVLAQVLLSQTISGKDEALDRLNTQVIELAELLNLERNSNANLRLDIARLSDTLQRNIATQEKMTRRISALEIEAKTTAGNLAEAKDEISLSESELKRHLLEIESLRHDIETLREVRTNLELEVGKALDKIKQQEIQSRFLRNRSKQLIGELGTADQKLELKENTIGNLRDRTKNLIAKLATSEEKTLLAQQTIEEREIRISEMLNLYARLDDDYNSEKTLTAEQNANITLLNRQLLFLRAEIKSLGAALEAAEVKDKESEAVIADLGRKLNRALASKVEELSRYRSEFFGRLRQVLGNRKGIQVVGDRFVFQSEVLFASGSARLGPDGKKQMHQLAETLIDIGRQIPQELNWILRVDGHTDRLPINTPQFPSNWELSSARAISVVKYLVSQGIPEIRLAATGFAANQPLDARDDEIGLRRNRRIELKLSQR